MTFAAALVSTLKIKWTAQQALAVVELLDDLRDRICAHYQIPLHDLLREQHPFLELPDDSPTATGDQPF